MNTNTPWVTLTNGLAAAAGTNSTSFVHSNVTECSQSGSGGGGGGGSPPSPSGSQSASTTMTEKERAAWREERARQAKADIEVLEAMLIAAVEKAQADRQRWAKEGRPRPTATTVETTSSPEAESLLTEANTGFYRVVRRGVHLFGITNDMNLSGVVKLPVEVGHDQGTLQVVTISADGSGIQGTEPLVAPFPPPFLCFEVDTTYLRNGVHSLRADATLVIPQTNIVDSPFLGLASPVVSVNVSNEISYPNWVAEFTDDLMLINVSSAYLEADWEFDVFGEQFDYIGTFAGHTSNGEIEIAWDLFDAQGEKREDLLFYTVTTIFPTGTGAPPPALPPSVSQTNPTLVKQVDNYPEEGQWGVARLDSIPHHYQNYDSYVQAINRIAQMAENSGGVVPLPGQTHRGWGEAFLIRTGPTATNIPTDWNVLYLQVFGNHNVRNFYYDGHGSPNTIGDQYGFLRADTVGLILNNSLSGPGTNNTRYRFVWLDGCKTAAGQWPAAFALGTIENKPLSTYTVRPGAFCGFSENISVSVNNGAGDGMVDSRAAEYRTQFVFYWSLAGQTVQDAFRNARIASNWAQGDYLRIYGYWGLRANQYNQKSQWPPP